MRILRKLLSRNTLAGVAEWQTRAGTQNPVPARACRFKSDLRYSSAVKDLRLLAASPFFIEASAGMPTVCPHFFRIASMLRFFLVARDTWEIELASDSFRASRRSSIRHGKAVGCRYIMGAVNPDRIVKELEHRTTAFRRGARTRTHVAALRVRNPRH